MSRAGLRPARSVQHLELVLFVLLVTLVALRVLEPVVGVLYPTLLVVGGSA